MTDRAFDALEGPTIPPPKVGGGGVGALEERCERGVRVGSVTADGAIRTVDAARDPDLFWALKGGGGGFGVVTRPTLRTRDLPATFGLVHWSLRVASDEAFERLLARFVDLYAERLHNAHWGEQASAHPERRFEVLRRRRPPAGGQNRRQRANLHTGSPASSGA